MRLVELCPGVYAVYVMHLDKEWLLTVATLNDDRLFSEYFGANWRAELT